MSGDPTLLLCCAAVLLACGVPALLALGGGGVRHLPPVGAAGLSAALIWTLLGWEPSVAVFQAAIAAVSMAAAVSALADRLGRGFAVVLAAIVVTTAVTVPLAVALFDVRGGVLAGRVGTLDFAGAVVLAVVPATIGAVLVGGDHGGSSRQWPRKTGWVPALGVVSAFTAALLGSELVLDDAAPRLLVGIAAGALGGAAGWALGAILLVHRLRGNDAATGVVAGAASVLAAPLWLDPVTISVIGVLSALLGRIVAGRFGAQRAFWVGVLGVPAVVGLVAAGVMADGRGLLASGQTGLVVAQIVAVVASVSLAGAVALVIRGCARWLRPRRGPDDRRHGTAAPAPGAR